MRVVLALLAGVAAAGLSWWAFGGFDAYRTPVAVVMGAVAGLVLVTWWRKS